MTLTLIQGPAGGGKSQVAAAMLTAGEIQVLSDVTSLWVALSGVVRGPGGRYPERLADDPALAIARYVQTVAVRQSLEEGFDTAVTTSQRGQEGRWRQMADDADVPFSTRTVDPGRAVVVARLSGPDGILSAACGQAISRWYG